MTNLWEQLPHPVWMLGIFFALTVVMVTVMKQQIGPLHVGDLELAGTKEKAAAVLKGWGEEGKRIVRVNTLLDFLFIPCYTTLLALLWFLMASKTSRFGAVSTILNVWAWLMWVAGILDVIENLCMLSMMGREPTELLARLSQICATVKFVITVVLIGVLFRK